MIYLKWLFETLIFSTLGLLVCFIIVAKTAQFVKSRPSWVKTAALLNLWPILLLGVIWDYAYQHTWAVLIFWEIAPKGEYMLTYRLQRHKRNGYVQDGWRFTRAIQICRLIEYISPGHCR